MKNMIGIALKIVLTLVMLGIIGVFALGYYFNPDRVKPMVVSHVQEQYKRTISIGDVSWRVFPRLGISIKDISLGNAPGFGEGNFAVLKSATVFVDTLKLLSGKVHVSTLELNSPSADLKVNAQGAGNWDDLVEGKKSSSSKSDQSTASGSGISNIEFNIESIEINDGAFTYQDQKTGEKYEVKNFNIASKNVAMGKDFPIDLKMKVSSVAPSLDADIIAKATLRIAENTKTVDLNAITLNGDISISSLQANGLKVSNLKTPIKLDKGVLDMSALSANLYGGTVNGSVRVNAQSKPADVLVNYDMKGTDIASLTRDLGQKQNFTGKLNMKGNVRFKAFPQKQQMKTSMAGSAAMNIQNGVLHGVDLPYFYAQGNNLMNASNVGKALGATAALEKGTNTGKTEFVGAKANFNLNAGVITNNDLIVYNARIYGAGAGTVNLNANTVDYKFKIQGVSKKGDQYVPAGQIIPLMITGSLDNPKMTVDIGAVAGNVVKNAVQQNLQQKGGIGGGLLKQILQ